jgi:hypothetical protein
VKVSAFRTAVSCLLLFSARLSASQMLALTLSSVETHADNKMELELFLNAPPNSAPASLQWTCRLPPGLNIVGIEADEAVNKAGKKLVCKKTKCILFGVSRTTISNGPVALVKIKVDQSLAGGERPATLKYPAHGRARTTKPEIQIGDVVAVSLGGKAIPVEPSTSSWPIR